MSIFEIELQCVLSYVIMGNIIFPTVTRLLGCFPVSDVSFFIAMMNMLFSHFCSIYSETYYINGLTVNVCVPSYFNGFKKC
jgi:hypothetical protein